MQLTGDEKRIQALFCELMSEDQRVAPGFENMWPHAQAVAQHRRQSFGNAFVVITSALLVAVVCSLAFWPRNRPDRPRSRDIASAIPESVVLSSRALPSENRGKVVSAAPSQPKRPVYKPPQRNKAKLAARAVINNAVALSTWRSPTANLMESGAGSLCSSLPQLNESASALKSFLRDNQLKERSQ